MPTRLAGTLLLVALALTLFSAPSTPAEATQGDYPRAGWTATLSTRLHGVRGTAEIVDERTVRLRHFFYDGGGPQVYAYLGAENSDAAFSQGIPIGPMLNRPGQPYVDQTLLLTLPEGQTLDGYHAIAIWCLEYGINFGSGAFQPPGSHFLPLVSTAPPPP